MPRGVENVDIDLETGLLGDEACGPSYTVAFMKKTAPDQSCTEYIEDDVLDAEEAKEEVRKEKDKLMDKLKRWFTSEELEME
ncbi:hypothetical protein [Geomicrobium sp. JCM 19039]|uniref:hypothetical protein n=1 Tax=Geomicrobium sp. JCM 19039 TaxID=1460636 RepID=UPI0012682BB5|nr:hypothetical protein [Geomicrobium sp. JCM 19039]